MNKTGLILVLVLQVSWIVGSAFHHEQRLRNDTTILLETQPVDPRDLLRGTYVSLGYPIARIPWEKVEKPTGMTEIMAGTPIYVVLEQGEKFARVKRASLTPIKASQSELMIEGIIQSVSHKSHDEVHVKYGIERYYVAEGRGEPRGEVTVEVAVSSGGKARIKTFYLNGKPY